ncbi:hypothetical protein [Parasitella parasitica]|uniref:Uncharacterized protein n=1 Tax=Parasitella parasitica TaxID=35722 RepID=A0A0B7NBU0_9FUNG|nr:hypothetical protein [Parasitella parasitica]
MPLEFGGSEAKPTIEEDFGSKFLQEGFLKLPPYVLKDKLDVLLEKTGYDGCSSLLRTVGFIHSGLSCTMVELDRPTAYVSPPVSRGNTIEISNSVSNFGSTVLPATMLSSSICCQIIKDVLDTVLSNKKQNQNDTSWVNSCLERPPLPSISSSSSSSSSLSPSSLSLPSTKMSYKRQKRQS